MAVLKGIDVIRRWVIQTVLKDRGKQGGVTITLPRNDFVDLNTSITAERIMRNGIDPNSITSVNQVENIINQLNKPRVVAADSPEGKGITEALLGKKGEVFNLQGEKLDPNLPIIGGTQQGKKINREFFERDAEGKDDIRKGIAKEVQEVKQRIDSGVATTVEKMLAMEPIDAMKEANLVIGRKGPYKNLTQEDAKKILQDTEDHIFERNVDIDPEDMFAEGGRIGFFMGSKLPKGLAALREMLNFMSKQSDKVKNPSEVLKMVNPKSLNVSLEDPRLQGKINKEGILASDIIKNFQSKMGEDRVQLVKDMLSAAKNIKKADTSQIKLKNEMIEDMIKKGVDREMAEEMATTMSRLARNMAGKVKDTPKLTDEGILELENILKNMETGGKKKRDLNADGGRIGFKKGMDRRTFMKIMAGLASLPVVGKVFKGAKVASKVAPVAEKAVGASSGQPPAYFFNLVKKIKNLGDDVTKTRSVSERQKVTAYKDYELTEDLTTGETTIQRMKIDDGNPTYYDEVLAEETYMNYKPGKGQADETTGKVADEYTEDTSYIRTSGPQKGDIYDTVDGVADDVVEEGTVFEDNVTDFATKEKTTKIKKAGGGVAYMLGE